jgi:hypothetical protein
MSPTHCVQDKENEKGGQNPKKRTVESLPKLIIIIICRWVDNIKMSLVEIGWGGMDWIGHDHDRCN